MEFHSKVRKSETLAKLFFSSVEHVPLQIERIERLDDTMKEKHGNTI